MLFTEPYGIEKSVPAFFSRNSIVFAVASKYTAPFAASPFFLPPGSAAFRYSACSNDACACATPAAPSATTAAMPNFRIRPYRFMFALLFLCGAFPPPSSANVCAPGERFKRHAATLPGFRRLSHFVARRSCLLQPNQPQEVLFGSVFTWV